MKVIYQLTHPTKVQILFIEHVTSPDQGLFTAEEEERSKDPGYVVAIMAPIYEKSMTLPKYQRSSWW